MDIDSCKQCEKILSPRKTRRNALFCDKRCQSLFNQAIFRELNPRTGLATGTVGAIGELRVGLDLLMKGYEVFRALSPCCSCDLAILKDKKLFRVEVKTAYRTRTGISYSKPKLGKYDVLALVLPEKINYEGLPI